jgi:hypothetical protein
VIRGVRTTYTAASPIKLDTGDGIAVSDPPKYDVYSDPSHRGAPERADFRPLFGHSARIELKN